jgi:hypothetical protein
LIRLTSPHGQALRLLIVIEVAQSTRASILRQAQYWQAQPASTTVLLTILVSLRKAEHQVETNA